MAKKTYLVVFKGGDGFTKQYSTNDREQAYSMTSGTHGRLYINHLLGRVRIKL